MTDYRVPSKVLRAQLEGQEVLLNPDSGTYHLVNETGRILLLAFEVGRSFEDGVADVVALTGEEGERVRIDAEAFVRAMTERGLLEMIN